MVGQQLRQDFQTGDHVGRLAFGKDAEQLQHAVQPPSHIEPFASRLQVHVAGMSGLRRHQHTVNELRRIPRGRMSRVDN